MWRNPNYIAYPRHTTPWIHHEISPNFWDGELREGKKNWTLFKQTNGVTLNENLGRYEFEKRNQMEMNAQQTTCTFYVEDTHATC